MSQSKQTKKKPAAPATQPTMLPAEGRVIRPVALAEIQEDQRQPRPGDAAKQANVNNIAETLDVTDGVARPVHPIQIRRTPPWADQAKPWTIFDGACRYLAAVMKGAVSIDADVIEMPEEKVFEAQVLTAMAREGLGPSAQLEAIRRFDEEHADVNAQNAAARLGMRTDVVRSLRKVNLLPPECRLRFVSGEHTLEVCDSLSRIEGATSGEKADRQMAASKAVAAMTPKKAREYILSTYLLRLSTAPFDREDATLNPSMGVCSTCPHRTGAQTALFGAEDQGDDCCTKAECWNAKAEATVAKNPPVEEKKEPKKAKAEPKADKPTLADLHIAGALAAGATGTELDARFPNLKSEDIDAGLRRLVAAGNVTLAPLALDDRRAGASLGGYARGAWKITADKITAEVLFAREHFHAADFMRLAESVLCLFPVADVSYVPMTAAVAPDEIDEDPPPSATCEPGGPPPPPPPVADEDPVGEGIEPDSDPWPPSAEAESGEFEEENL